MKLTLTIGKTLDDIYLLFRTRYLLRASSQSRIRAESLNGSFFNGHLSNRNVQKSFCLALRDTRESQDCRYR